MTGGPILVTGAGGFVCSELVLALDRAGIPVIGTDRSFDAQTRARLHGLPLIEAPLETALIRTGPLGGVIHGAALTADPDSLGMTAADHLAANVGLLMQTLVAARAAGAGRFVFLSSMGVFAPDDGPVAGGRFTEATRPCGTIPYAAAKRAGEIITTAAADAGMATLSLRLGNITGPHEAVRDSRQHLCLIGRMLQEARSTAQITLSDPQASREWAWLPDLADAVAALMRATWPPCAVLHAGTPPVATHLDLAQAIAARMPGVRVVVNNAPCDPIRPPMASCHPGPMSQTRWTPLDAILDALIRDGVPT